MENDDLKNYNVIVDKTIKDIFKFTDLDHIKQLKKNKENDNQKLSEALKALIMEKYPQLVNSISKVIDISNTLNYLKDQKDQITNEATSIEITTEIIKDMEDTKEKIETWTEEYTNLFKLKSIENYNNYNVFENGYTSINYEDLVFSYVEKLRENFDKNDLNNCFVIVFNLIKLNTINNKNNVNINNNQNKLNVITSELFDIVIKHYFDFDFNTNINIDNNTIKNNCNVSYLIILLYLINDNTYLLYESEYYQAINFDTNTNNIFKSVFSPLMEYEDKLIKEIFNIENYNNQNKNIQDADDINIYKYVHLIVKSYSLFIKISFVRIQKFLCYYNIHNILLEYILITDSLDYINMHKKDCIDNNKDVIENYPNDILNLYNILFYDVKNDDKNRVNHYIEKLIINLTDLSSVFNECIKNYIMYVKNLIDKKAIKNLINSDIINNKSNSKYISNLFKFNELFKSINKLENIIGNNYTISDLKKHIEEITIQSLEENHANLFDIVFDINFLENKNKDIINEYKNKEMNDALNVKITSLTNAVYSNTVYTANLRDDYKKQSSVLKKYYFVLFEFIFDDNCYSNIFCKTISNISSYVNNYIYNINSSNNNKSSIFYLNKKLISFYNADFFNSVENKLNNICDKNSSKFQSSYNIIKQFNTSLNDSLTDISKCIFDNYKSDIESSISNLAESVKLECLCNITSKKDSIIIDSYNNIILTNSRSIQETIELLIYYFNQISMLFNCIDSSNKSNIPNRIKNLKKEVLELLIMTYIRLLFNLDSKEIININNQELYKNYKIFYNDYIVLYKLSHDYEITIKNIDNNYINILVNYLKKYKDIILNIDYDNNNNNNEINNTLTNEDKHILDSFINNKNLNLDNNIIYILFKDKEKLNYDSKSLSNKFKTKPFLKEELNFISSDNSIAGFNYNGSLKPFLINKTIDYMNTVNYGEKTNTTSKDKIRNSIKLLDFKIDDNYKSIITENNRISQNNINKTTLSNTVANKFINSNATQNKSNNNSNVNSKVSGYFPFFSK